MKKWMLSLAVVISLVSACSKDDDGPVVTSLDTVAGDYNVEAVTVNLGSNKTDVLSEYFETCQKDDILQLKKDKSYANVDAGVVCSPSNAYTGTWDIVSTSRIRIDGDEYTIKSFDGKKLILTEPFVVGSVTAELETIWRKR
jgi:hypothetical protein